jgi:hypothetical protein
MKDSVYSMESVMDGCFINPNKQFGKENVINTRLRDYVKGWFIASKGGGLLTAASMVPPNSAVTSLKK